MGIGHDVSFDIEMQKRGFTIVAVDPLEECCDYARDQLIFRDDVTILQAGLWTKNDFMTFYSPKSTNSNSWSITNEHGTQESQSKTFSTITLSEILKLESIKDSAFFILKIDAEGAERYLFDDIIQLSNNFKYICIELDYLQLLAFKSFWERILRIIETRKKFKKLKAKDLQLIHTEAFNFFWINLNTYTSETKSYDGKSRI